MSDFKSEREAKEYLISRITDEAQEQGIALSDLERKMLYFSETGWTLPSILEINAEFEREYDNDEYEQKIAGLVRSIETKNKTHAGDGQFAWDDAVVKLSEGDHYLLVLIGLGRSRSVGRLSKWLPERNFYGTGKAREKGDYSRLILVAVGIVASMLVITAIMSLFR